MSLNTAQLEFLAARGMSLADAIELSRLGDVRKDPTAAERKRRQREREAEARVAQGDERDMSRRDVARDNAPFPAPSPSFPPDPQTNPAPTHTHGGDIPRARKADFPKPDWADAQVWADFLANRKRKRLANTATAHKRFLADIAALADEEWPPGRLLEHAVARGWGAIFDPRDRNERHVANRQDQRREEPVDSLVRTVARRQAARAAGELYEPEFGAGDRP